MVRKRKATETVDIKLRLPEPLRAKIERAAKARGESMNTEMVERLERSFARQHVIQDFVAALGELRRSGEEFGKFDYKTYFLVNTLLGLKPSSREKWEKMPEPPTPEEHDAAVAAHEGKRK